MITKKTTIFASNRFSFGFRQSVLNFTLFSLSFRNFFYCFVSCSLMFSWPKCLYCNLLDHHGIPIPSAKYHRLFCWFGWCSSLCVYVFIKQKCLFPLILSMIANANINATTCKCFHSTKANYHWSFIRWKKNSNAVLPFCHCESAFKFQFSFFGVILLIYIWICVVVFFCFERFATLSTDSAPFNEWMRNKAKKIVCNKDLNLRTPRTHWLLRFIFFVWTILLLGTSIHHCNCLMHVA